MLTTMRELIRMIRDGDPNSDNQRAVELYANLDDPK